MLLSMKRTELFEYVNRQLNHFFPDGDCTMRRDMESAFDLALERVEYCFLRIRIPHYHQEGNSSFNHLHSDQYSTFLYFLSNSLWTMYGEKAKCLCDKLVFLNRCLCGCWLSYKVNLPNIFCMSHPLGAVLGHAVYSDYLFVGTGATIQSSTILDGIPQLKLGKGLYLATDASIIGDISIGDYVSVGIGTCVYKQDIPNRSIVYRDASGGGIGKASQ